MSRPGSFWARRKARVEAEAAEDARRAEEARADAVAQDLAEKSDEDILAEYGLPDPDDLVPGDGIAGFMRREIPERLRRRAMRKLWRSNPVLACVDGLNDYDDDYTNAATDMPGVKTAYQIGKGMKAHVEALAAEEEAKQKAAAKPPEALEDGTAPDAVALTEAGTVSEADAMSDVGAQADPAAIAPPSGHAAPAETTEIPAENERATTKVADVPHGTSETPSYTTEESPHRPRRMRFRFEETG
ncbi:hypothetical protein FIU97_14485 [Roseivivax sp. THAF40]|uniref:DUF3306 domain-containing protein n=1 Tax=unclassified Roseivivax TaxID=2639302 RepID=UPI0012695253|nr:MULTISPECIES: DUF3306 domain-containing protein [unclassified Roseivivax]QFS83954.1 hypothetical protein FIV09_14045 [Roseivivax sp. THAF197b]QFT47786.1 hypothetical protein FIU97_14485 [Roseivivax sp. THAF40]